MTDVPYVGTVHSLVEKKDGWFSVEIAVAGKQWPVKADTKLESLLKQVREIRDADLTATFTVSESESKNINPKSGKPYTERRLEKVEVGARAVVNANGSPSSGGDGMSKDEWARKDSAADKRACIAIAVSALTHTMPSEPTEEDLRAFIQRVKFLSREWHVQVEAVRAGDESDVPFSPFVTQEDADGIPY